MKYLEVLNERNKENQARKNKAMDRPTKATGKPGKHSTDGSERGRRERPAQRVRNVKIRPGETRDVITKGRTGGVNAAGRLIGPNRPFADLAVKRYTAGPKGKLPEHIEYKRLAALMAEALGYEIDEAAPLAALVRGGVALAGRGLAAMGRAAGSFLKQKAKEKAIQKGNEMVADKAEQIKQKMGMAESYMRIGMALAEAREAYIDKESQEEVKAKKPDGGFAGPMARGVSKPGGKGVKGAATKDKFVRASIRRGGEAIRKAAKKKLGVDIDPEKIATKNLAQVGKQINKKRAKKKGLGIPRETPDIARADREEDKKKMAGKPERSRRRR